MQDHIQLESLASCADVVRTKIETNTRVRFRCNKMRDSFSLQRSVAIRISYQELGWCVCACVQKLYVSVFGLSPCKKGALLKLYRECMCLRRFLICFFMEDLNAVVCLSVCNCNKEMYRYLKALMSLSFYVCPLFFLRYFWHFGDSGSHHSVLG